MNLDEFIQQLKSIEQSKIRSPIFSIKHLSYKDQTENNSKKEYYRCQLRRLKKVTYSVKDEIMDRNLHKIEQHIANINTLLKASPELKSIFGLFELGFEDERKRIEYEMMRLDASSRKKYHIYQQSIKNKEFLDQTNQLERQENRDSLHSMKRPNSQKHRISYQQKIIQTESQHSEIYPPYSKKQQFKKDKNQYSEINRLRTEYRMSSNNTQKLKNQSKKYGVVVQGKNKYQIVSSSTKPKIKPEKLKEQNKDNFSYRNFFIGKLVSKKESSQLYYKMLEDLTERYKQESKQAKEINLKMDQQFEKLVDKLAVDPRNESLRERCGEIIQFLLEQNKDNKALLFNLIVG